jgi:hypothetical protein
MRPAPRPLGLAVAKRREVRLSQLFCDFGGRYPQWRPSNLCLLVELLTVTFGRDLPLRALRAPNYPNRVSRNALQDGRAGRRRRQLPGPAKSVSPPGPGGHSRLPAPTMPMPSRTAPVARMPTAPFAGTSVCGRSVARGPSARGGARCPSWRYSSPARCRSDQDAHRQGRATPCRSRPNPQAGRQGGSRGCGQQSQGRHGAGYRYSRRWPG